MRTTGRLMWLLGACFLFVDGIYLLWSLRADNFEVVGLIVLGLSGILCWLVAFYFGRVVHAAGGETWAEDRLDAEIDDGDPEVGFYSPWSWWPILLAGTISIAILGFAISPWIAMIAFPMLLVAVVGWTFEYYRGNFAT